jgi:hypothetical protein
VRDDPTPRFGGQRRSDSGGGGGPDHKIKKPLDWYTVSDHAEYLGVFSKMTDPRSPLAQLEIAKRVTSKDPPSRSLRTPKR